MTSYDYGRKPGDGFRHIELADTVSTNLECLERARAGEPGGLWITARRQSGGRARRGRAWVSEPGNLYASLLLIDPAPISSLSTLPLAVSLAVYDAVSMELPPETSVKIKWPNDVLVDGRKVSGILLEGETLPDGRHGLVIGCGINLVHKPQEALYPVATLQEYGSTATRESLFARLYQSMSLVLDRWNGGKGTAAIVADWRNVAAGIGQPITVNLPDRSLKGIFTDIDAQGMLELDLGDGKKQFIAAGDVFL
jgi:BirA family transcriptional regulator, biotin operon repressor / biotin---[acetyl-CoA-carboxylase] ligase